LAPSGRLKKRPPQPRKSGRPELRKSGGLVNRGNWVVPNSENRCADGLFSFKPITPFSPEISEIDRTMPIVVETEQNSNRTNFSLKSKPRKFDGPLLGL
jgi:hypothetical protein